MTSIQIIRGVRGVALGLAAAAFSACDFKVTNPGPTLDKFLSDSLSFAAQVNGAAYSLSDGLNYQVLHSAIAARELFPTGQSGQFGIEPRNWVGFLVSEEQSSPWNMVQRSRWLADQTLARMRATLGDASFARHPLVAEAQVWRGFAYRVLGESMCVSIVDKGPARPPQENLVRAESSFTNAIATAKAANKPVLVTAAYAGRAQVRVLLGKWGEASTDASRDSVPTSFVYKMPYFGNVDEYGYNRTMWSSTDSAVYKAHSVWNTWYAAYTDTTPDPRVRYSRTTRFGAGAFPAVPGGKVPFWPQMKYSSRTAGINLASGREARLIEAEAALRTGDIATAFTRIDTVRAAAGAPPLTRPTTIDEAWRLLKRERGIELWLEGRRLGDFRRWAAATAPGALDPLEVPGGASYLEGQNTCFPVSREEINTNPNLTP
ncbi:MAG: hypothetical protein NVS1B4_07330 [Gemmatimonadaceae bacterium]